MKIEFIENGSDDCPLIRMYGLSSEDVGQLLRELENLAIRRSSTVQLNQVEGLEFIGRLRLIAVLSDNDRGLVPTGENMVFEWQRTASGWQQVLGLIQPFQSAPLGDHYQWLDELAETSLLLTADPDGRW